VQTKAKAVIEVVVVFSVTLALVALIALSPLGRWERQVTNRFFIEYAVMIAFPLLLLVVARRDLASYGLSLRNFSYHLSVAGIALVPVLVAIVPLAVVNYTQWGGALLMAGVEIAVLFVLGWLLKRKPTYQNGMLLSGALVIAGSSLLQQTAVAYAISGFVFYLLFLGLGEELLFRGYIQSRLNAAWGRPFQFFGVNWGWGVVITSVLFGLMHVLNLSSLIAGHWQLAWPWGFWTFFAGFISGFVREKTGSIVAPTILHGLPQALQAIGLAFLGLWLFP
jgi:membrane protease YdiL (CAAX protease family)